MESWRALAWPKNKYASPGRPTMNNEKNENDISEEVDQLNREHASVRLSAEGRIHDIRLGHYEKLAVLQTGVFALSVTFLVGLNSQATAHNISILHLWVLIICWIAMLCSIPFCIFHNWINTNSFIALDQASAWRSKKIVQKKMASVPGTAMGSGLEAPLYISGVTAKWENESTQKFLWRYRLAECLGWVAHATFLLGIVMLGIFVIINVIHQEKYIR
jgi:hypothetical protein